MVKIFFLKISITVKTTTNRIYLRLITVVTKGKSVLDHDLVKNITQVYSYPKLWLLLRLTTLKTFVGKRRQSKKRVFKPYC